MNADPTPSDHAAPALWAHAPTAPARGRGVSSWPFGPVGVREERRQPYRANDVSMSAAPRRRWSDFTDDRR
jgi:hypothetical protein